MEQAGRPTVVVATDAFEALAREAAAARGLAAVRTVVVPHPIGGVSRNELQARGEAAVDLLLEILSLS